MKDNKESVCDNITRKLELLRGTHIGDRGVSLGFALEQDIEGGFPGLGGDVQSSHLLQSLPSSKALVVRLVKRHLNALLLAIGDGANDVSMIQADMSVLE
ncbi:hypothetical protein PR048_033779 [Dryococelus australis]|uniref:Uncharacterized protein n=1 Tax=Dryococelus australis TaxID=614101 RepID=A0ABQ9FYX1_9NEOP|nr:hypothetical protein PR048_033779 [Dryococelus australis]